MLLLGKQEDKRNLLANNGLLWWTGHSDGLVIRTATKMALSCFSVSTGRQWMEWAVRWLGTAFGIFQCLLVRAQRGLQTPCPPLARAPTTKNVSGSGAGSSKMTGFLWLTPGAGKVQSEPSVAGVAGWGKLLLRAALHLRCAASFHCEGAGNGAGQESAKQKPQRALFVGPSGSTHWISR
jgi:hypothetical protein